MITCDPPTLAKHEPWYVVPDRPAALTIRVGERIHLPTPTASETPVTAARLRTAEIRTHYETELGYGKR